MMAKNYNIYIDVSKKLKVLSDPKRLQIVDMLSCGELCACQILEKFDITQPTLSADMKKLEDCQIVISRRDGKNVFYSLNLDTLNEIEASLEEIFKDSPDCICNEKGKIRF